MLTRILIDILLFLTPFAIYAVYAWAVQRNQQANPKWRDTPWALLTVGGLVLVIGSFLWLGLQSGEPPGEYVPPHMEDGKIVPGEVRR